MRRLLQRTRLVAYLAGMAEFRRTYTWNPGEDLIETYDAGRDRMHALTFRRWDH